VPGSQWIVPTHDRAGASGPPSHGTSVIALSLQSGGGRFLSRAEATAVLTELDFSAPVDSGRDEGRPRTSAARSRA